MAVAIYSWAEARARRVLTYKVGDALLNRIGNVLEITAVEENGVWCGGQWFSDRTLLPSGATGVWCLTTTPQQVFHRENIKLLMKHPRAYLAAQRGDDATTWGELIKLDL